MQSVNYKIMTNIFNLHEFDWLFGQVDLFNRKRVNENPLILNISQESLITEEKKLVIPQFNEYDTID